jgi:hypothetical protein
MGAVRRRILRQLRRSPWAWCLLDELICMSEGHDMALERAISTIAQSDPIIKLLQQVALGRMKPTDAGLRAVTESWLKTYQNVLDAASFNRQALLRLDPQPRIAMLIEAGVLDPGNETSRLLQASFDKQMAQARPE